jgi:hypothetical protein
MIEDWNLYTCLLLIFGLLLIYMCALLLLTLRLLTKKWFCWTEAFS